MGDRPSFNTVGDALSRAVKATRADADYTSVVHDINTLSRFYGDLERTVRELRRQVWWLRVGSAVWLVGSVATLLIWLFA